MALCEAFDLPLISLVDTPGMMVGPEVEETALVRHCSRLFAIGPNMTVPLIAVVVGRGYGLGAQAMVGGSFLEPLLSLAWPTGELGPMGIEGAVRLGMKNELAAIDDEDEREQRLNELVAGPAGALPRAQRRHLLRDRRRHRPGRDPLADRRDARRGPRPAPPARARSSAGSTPGSPGFGARYALTTASQRRRGKRQRWARCG